MVGFKVDPRVGRLDRHEVTVAALEIRLSGGSLVLVQCKDQFRMLVSNMCGHAARQFAEFRTKTTLQEGLATRGEVTTDQAHPFHTARCEVTVHGVQ